MSQLDEWRRKIRKNTLSDPQEILEVMQSNAKIDPKYRLELIYDEEAQTILLQGNQAGLDHLLDTISRLAKPDSPTDAHAHFDRASGLTKNDLDLIIRKVGDYPGK